MPKNLKLKTITRIFSIYPQQIYAMEWRGLLPKRPRGEITVEWLEALSEWYIKRRGALPKEAKKLLKKLKVQNTIGV